jgi:hypothetical protein
VKHGRVLVVLGAVLIGAAVLVVLATWYVDGARRDDAVRGLARAAAGCETSIDLGAGGEYWVYVEPDGDAPDLPGDCEQAIASGEGLEVEIVAPDGRVVEIDADDGRSYDRAGSAGTSIGSIEVTATGTHLVTVVSGEGGVVAIGRDPDTAGVAWVVAALASAGLLAIGLGLVVLGLRPPPPAPPEPGRPLPPPFTGLSDFVPVSGPPLVGAPGVWAPPSLAPPPVRDGA